MGMSVSAGKCGNLVSSLSEPEKVYINQLIKVNSIFCAYKCTLFCDVTISIYVTNLRYFKQ